MLEEWVVDLLRLVELLRSSPVICLLFLLDNVPLCFVDSTATGTLSALLLSFVSEVADPANSMLGDSAFSVSSLLRPQMFFNDKKRGAIRCQNNHSRIERLTRAGMSWLLIEKSNANCMESLEMRLIRPISLTSLECGSNTLRQSLLKNWRLLSIKWLRVLYTTLFFPSFATYPISYCCLEDEPPKHTTTTTRSVDEQSHSTQTITTTKKQIFLLFLPTPGMLFKSLKW